MLKNVASQKLTVFAFDSTTNLPKTGDAANLTAYVSKDSGTITVLADTSATEMDSTNAKGYYLFDLAQGETNATQLHFTCKSSTSNIVVIACPPVHYPYPTTGLLAPTVIDRTLDVSAGGEAGLDWANVGSPTTTLALTGTTVGTLTTYTGNTPQTGDSFARIGATGSGLTTITAKTSLLPTAAEWTNLNSMGTVFNTSSGILDYTLTGEVTAATSTTVTISGTNFSTLTNAYIGQTLTLRVHGESRTITGYSGAGAPTVGVFTVSPAFLVATPADFIGDLVTVTAGYSPKVDSSFQVTVGAMAANVITAAATATDFGTEMAGAVWDAPIASYSVEDSFGNVLNNMVEESAGLYRLTTAALANAPGGGSSSITVLPLETTVSAPQFSTAVGDVVDLIHAQNASTAYLFSVVDSNGTAVNLGSSVVRFVVHDKSGTTLFFLATNTSGVAVSGASSNQVTVSVPASSVTSRGNYFYKLWDITNTDVLASGTFTIALAPVT